MFFQSSYSDKSIEGLRRELIDDAYGLAFGGGCPAAILDVSDIEKMSDEEVLKEARRRGMV